LGRIIATPAFLTRAKPCIAARPAIKAAFAAHGVVDIAFDSRDELEKILQECAGRDPFCKGSGR
jgi:hypothetical protein